MLTTSNKRERVGSPATDRKTRVRLAESKPIERTAAEDALLVRRAQDGDREAFAQLVERWWERLYRWLYHLSHDRHAAEDLAQDAFLKAYANLYRFRPEGKFSAWLFRIAYNSFVNRRRKTGRTRFNLPDQMPDPGVGPEEQALSREEMQRLTRAIHRLPHDFRAPFLLRVEEELSFREIARVLGVSEVTARWRVFKARQKLMQVLTSEVNRDEP